MSEISPDNWYLADTVVETASLERFSSPLFPTVSSRLSERRADEEDRITALALRIADITGGVICDGDALSSNPEPFSGLHSFVNTVAWLQRVGDDYRCHLKFLGGVISTAHRFLMSYGLQSEVALSVITEEPIRSKLSEWAYSLMIARRSYRRDMHASSSNRAHDSDPLLKRLFFVATESYTSRSLPRSSQSSPALELPDYLTCLLFAEVRDRKNQFSRDKCERSWHTSTHLIRTDNLLDEQTKSHYSQHRRLGVPEQTGPRSRHAVAPQYEPQTYAPETSPTSGSSFRAVFSTVSLPFTHEKMLGQGKILMPGDSKQLAA